MYMALVSLQIHEQIGVFSYFLFFLSFLHPCAISLFISSSVRHRWTYACSHVNVVKYEKSAIHEFYFNSVNWSTKIFKKIKPKSCNLCNPLENLLFLFDDSKCSNDVENECGTLPPCTDGLFCFVWSYRIFDGAKCDVIRCMNTVCCQCIGISYMRCACVAYQRIRTRTNGSSSSNSSRSSTFCIGMFTLTVCVYMNSITCQTIHICCMRTKVIHEQKKKRNKKNNRCQLLLLLLLLLLAALSWSARCAYVYV